MVTPITMGTFGINLAYRSEGRFAAVILKSQTAVVGRFAPYTATVAKVPRVACLLRNRPCKLGYADAHGDSGGTPAVAERRVRGSQGSMTELSRALFLSYASQDAKASQRICDALRAGGIESGSIRASCAAGIFGIRRSAARSATARSSSR
jgi:hypothetical protein